MSAQTRNGRVPEWHEAEAYAREQAQDAGDYEPIAYADRRG